MTITEINTLIKYHMAKYEEANDRYIEAMPDTAKTTIIHQNMMYHLGEMNSLTEKRVELIVDNLQKITV